MKFTKEQYRLSLINPFIMDCYDGKSKAGNKVTISSSGEHSYATDNMVAIRTPNIHDIDTDGIEGRSHDVRKLLKVFYFPQNVDKTISYNSLKSALSKIGKDEKKKYKSESCPECDGVGEITWVYFDSLLSSYESLDECPVCKGNGEIPIAAEYTTTYVYKNEYIRIGNNHFSPSNIHKLINIMEVIGADKIQLIHQERMLPNAFQIEDVTILIAPIAISPTCKIHEAK